MGTSAFELSGSISVGGAEQTTIALKEIDTVGNTLVNTTKGITQAHVDLARAMMTTSGASRQQTQEINSVIASLQAEGRALDVVTQQGVTAWQRNAEETKRWAESLGATDAQLLRIDSTIQSVSTRGEAASGRLMTQQGNAMMRVAFGLDMIARSSDGSIRGIRSVITGISGLAFMFGAEGALAGAVISTGVVIYDFFRRTQHELDKLNEKAHDMRASFLKSGDVAGLTKEMSGLFSGQRTETLSTKELKELHDFGLTDDAIKSGIQRIVERQQVVAALLKDYKPTAQSYVGGTGAPGAVDPTLGNLNTEAQHLAEQLQRLHRLYDPLKGDVGALTASAVEQTDFEIRLGKEKKKTHDIEKDEVSALKDLHDLGLMRDADLGRVLALEQKITQQLDHRDELHLTDAVVASLAKKLETLQSIYKIGLATFEIAQSEGDGRMKGVSLDTNGKHGVLIGQNSKPTHDLDNTPEMVEWRARMKHFEEAGSKLGHSVAQTLAGSLRAGFDAAFSGGNFFVGAGKALLAGLGSIFEQMGEQMIMASPMFIALSEAMTNPFTAGPALLAEGIALVALGSLLGAIAHGGDGGGGGGGGGSSGGPRNSPAADVTRVTIGGGQSVQSASAIPQPRPVAVYATIIGRNDPRAQRDIVELLQSAARRGLAV